MVIKKVKSGLSKIFGGIEEEPEYIEVDLGQETKKAKILIRPFVLKQYEDINRILDALREGYSIAVIDIRPLKTKDIIELKRAVSKIKKTAEALEGQVAGFGENTLIVTPQFAEIYKAPAVQQPKVDKFM